MFQEEFTDDPTLGFVDAGIIFVIHSPKKVPQFDGLGLSSPVGMRARVTIRQVKVKISKMCILRGFKEGSECIHAQAIFFTRNAFIPRL